jgi:hypothetical protein
MKELWEKKIQPILCSNYLLQVEKLDKEIILLKSKMDMFRDENNELINKNNQLDNELYSKIVYITQLQEEIDDIQKENKHLTLDTFMSWLEKNIKPVSRTHLINADLPKRMIRNSAVRPSFFLANCVTEEDKEIILSFAEKVIYYKTFTDEDDLVFKFNTRFDRLFPVSTYYRYDRDYSGFEEYWATPIQTINYINKENHYGDCFSGDTKIIVKDKRDEIIKNVSFNELKDTWIFYDALSYDFNKKKSVFKPITNFMNKGIKPVFEVKARKGGTFKSTGDHKFFVKNKTNSILFNAYKWVKLTDIDMNKRQACAIKGMPDEGITLPDELCNYIGSYVADGNFDGYKITIAGDNEIRQNKLRNDLDKLNLNYLQSKRKVHAYTTVHVKNNDWIKPLTASMGSKGLYKQFPDIVMKANKETIKKVLYYYGRRDGTKKNDKIVTYSTISDKLTDQIKLLLTKIGIHYTYALQHQNRTDAKRHPIHRIHIEYSPKEVMPEIEHNLIMDYNYVGNEEVFDITVADTHNFVLSETNIIAHNCDNISTLKYWCLKLLLNKYFNGWDTKRLRCFLNWAMRQYYHAMLAWVKKGVNDWIPIETTFFNENFRDFWINNLTLRSNEIGYKINFSYDEDSEYDRI